MDFRLIAAFLSLLPTIYCEESANVTFFFSPNVTKKIVEETEKEFQLVVVNCTYSALRIKVEVDKNYHYVVSVGIRNVSEELYSQNEFDNQTFTRNTIEINIKNKSEFNVTFVLRGLFVGIADIEIVTEFICDDARECGTNFEKRNKYETSVVRSQLIYMTIFQYFMMAMVFLNYINMGVQLDLSVVWKVLKRPVGPIIGFVCQFTCMPLAAYAYGYLLLQPHVEYRVAFFTLGCSPGGSGSNLWTLLLHGDINLSITMTFVSTLSALGMMPLWLYTLGKEVFRRGEVTIPFTQLIITLVTLTAPLLAGILVKRFLPKVAKVSKKIIRPFALLVTLVGVVMGSATNTYIYFLFTWQMAVTGICIAMTGYIFGAFFAWLGRLDRPQIMAVSIETAIQNSSITFVILVSTLGQPEADLAAVPIIIQLLTTTAPLWLIYLFFRLWKCFSSRCREEKNQEEQQDEPDIKKQITKM